MKKIFSKNGILHKAISNFNYRNEQLEMASAIQYAIIHKQKLIIEAGTGIGKTFAYLAPILTAGKKTLISTGSKNLQDQLYKKDLPSIKKALNFSGHIVLLKGKANYLCIERLNQLLLSGLIDDKDLLQDLDKIRTWQTYTKTGDFSECPNLSETSKVLAQINSNNEDCNPSDHFNCYINKIRKKALNADIIIINHHLFFSDMMLKEKGFTNLIPNVDVTVFDEAHQLPDLASIYFSESLYSKQIFDISQELIILHRTELKDADQLAKASDLMQKSIKDIRLTMPQGLNKGNLVDLLKNKEISKAIQHSSKTILFILEIIALYEKRTSLLTPIKNKLTSILATLTNLEQLNLKNFCYWFETYTTNFVFHITPLSIAEKFNDTLKEDASWIFTSATLSINNDVGYFCQRLGLTQYHSKILYSPFNYLEQALLYVPYNLPKQNCHDTAEKLMPIILPLIKANAGNCFILCTSYKIMHQLADYMRQLTNFKILEQTKASKVELLEEFMQSENAVLIGTSSFWEGVDVKGNALSLVIIDKLPFTSPDDPLLKAKINACRENNLDPFQLIQLPEAVIALKQGFGRLIRDINDSGVVTICDSRLVASNYGNVFLASLPKTKRTRNEKKVIEFLQN